MDLKFLPWLAAAIYIPLAAIVWAVAWAGAPWWGVLIAALLTVIAAPSVSGRAEVDTA